jgi:hemerythrin-like metal-binding protein
MQPDHFTSDIHISLDKAREFPDLFQLGKCDIHEPAIRNWQTRQYFIESKNQNLLLGWRDKESMHPLPIAARLQPLPPVFQALTISPSCLIRRHFFPKSHPTRLLPFIFIGTAGNYLRTKTVTYWSLSKKDPPASLRKKGLKKNPFVPISLSVRNNIMAITWKNDFSVGISEMDSQHQRLVAMFNQLEDAMGKGKGKEVIGKILAELAKYTQTHFTCEEVLMRFHNYPDISTHRIEHTKLTHRVLAFKLDFEAGKATLSLPVLNFIEDWLVTHIQVSDKHYGKMIAEKRA